MGRQLGERLEHEAPLVHARVRDDQPFLVDAAVAEEQQVDDALEVHPGQLVDAAGRPGALRRSIPGYALFIVPLVLYFLRWPGPAAPPG